MEFKKIQWLTVLFAFTVIELVFLYKIITNQATSELIIAICIIGIYFLVMPVLDRLEEISFGKGGVKAKLSELNKMTTDFIFLSMGEKTYDSLINLSTGNYGEYKLEQFKGLWSELYYLRNLGYVDLIEGSANSIHEIPSEGQQLSVYIKITEAGRKYIKLRHELDAAL